MMRTLFAVVLAAGFISAQTPAFPVKIEVITESAQCDAVAPSSACLRYTAPASAGDFGGVFEPGVARLRISGPTDGQPATIQATVLSPVGRQWLGVRGIGETAGGTSISGPLPLDVEVYADEAQLSATKSGRFVAVLSVSRAGTTSAVKLPVQLTVTAGTDAIRPDPDFIPDITVTAAPGARASRYTFNVARTEPGSTPVYVSVTPETSDSEKWLAADLRLGAAQCADQPAPCGFEAVVSPPQRAGTYWGVLTITGDGFADRISLRLTVNPAPQMNPITIEPRQITLSAPLGSNFAVSTVVSLKGGNRDGVAYRASYTNPWLAVEPAIGTWPVALRLVLSPAGLEPGVYTDAVVLRSMDTNEVLASIPVQLHHRSHLCPGGHRWRRLADAAVSGESDAG